MTRQADSKYKLTSSEYEMLRILDSKILIC